MDAALPKEKAVQLGDVGLHFGKVHRGIRIEYAVDGQALFDHQQH